MKKPTVPAGNNVPNMQFKVVELPFKRNGGPHPDLQPRIDETASLLSQGWQIIASGAFLIQNPMVDQEGQIVLDAEGQPTIFLDLIILMFMGQKPSGIALPHTMLSGMPRKQ